MTNSQIKTLIKVLHMAEELNYKKGSYEIKEYEVTELECGLVSVVLETGRKGDEGTLAELICRQRVHLFIGKRGGITYYDKNVKSKRLSPNECILTISLAQNG